MNVDLDLNLNLNATVDMDRDAGCVSPGFVLMDHGDTGGHGSARSCADSGAA